MYFVQALYFYSELFINIAFELFFKIYLDLPIIVPAGVSPVRSMFSGENDQNRDRTLFYGHFGSKINIGAQKRKFYVIPEKMFYHRLGRKLHFYYFRFQKWSG